MSVSLSINCTWFERDRYSISAVLVNQCPIVLILFILTTCFSYVFYIFLISLFLKLSLDSDNMDPSQSVDRPAEGGAEEGEGMDGVTSEGEKVVLETEDTPEIEVKITPTRFSRRLKLRKS